MDEDEKAKGSNDANDISAFKMDEYDNEESTSLGKSLFSPTGAEFTADSTAMGAFANIKGLSFYRDSNEDPYITLKEVSIWLTKRDFPTHLRRTMPKPSVRSWPCCQQTT